MLGDRKVSLLSLFFQVFITQRDYNIEEVLQELVAAIDKLGTYAIREISSYMRTRISFVCTLSIYSIHIFIFVSI